MLLWLCLHVYLRSIYVYVSVKYSLYLRLGHSHKYSTVPLRTFSTSLLVNICFKKWQQCDNKMIMTRMNDIIQYSPARHHVENNDKESPLRHRKSETLLSLYAYLLLWHDLHYLFDIDCLLYFLIQYSISNRIYLS